MLTPSHTHTLNHVFYYKDNKPLILFIQTNETGMCHYRTGVLLSNRKREWLRDSDVKIDYFSLYSTPLWLAMKLAACRYRNGFYWATSNSRSFALLSYTGVIK